MNLAHLSIRVPFRLWFAATAFTAALLLQAGCASPEYTYTTKTADGKRLTFSMRNGAMEQAEMDGARVLIPRMLPDAPHKRLRYLFGIDVSGTAALQHVTIEDVSDDKPVVLVDDAAPEVKEGRWASFSKWLVLDDPELHWITYLDDSFRVYRVTITRAGQPPQVVYQPQMVPGFGKAAMRQMLGAKI